MMLPRRPPRPTAFLGSASDTNAAAAPAGLTTDGLVMAEAAVPHGARGRPS